MLKIFGFDNAKSLRSLKFIPPVMILLTLVHIISLENADTITKVFIVLGWAALTIMLLILIGILKIENIDYSYSWEGHKATFNNLTAKLLASRYNKGVKLYPLEVVEHLVDRYLRAVGGTITQRGNGLLTLEWLTHNLVIKLPSILIDQIKLDKRILHDLVEHVLNNSREDQSHLIESNYTNCLEYLTEATVAQFEKRYEFK